MNPDDPVHSRLLTEDKKKYCTYLRKWHVSVHDDSAALPRHYVAPTKQSALSLGQNFGCGERICTPSTNGREYHRLTSLYLYLTIRIPRRRQPSTLCPSFTRTTHICDAHSRQSNALSFARRKWSSIRPITTPSASSRRPRS